jgi:hypothetical protein
MPMRSSRTGGSGGVVGTGRGSADIGVRLPHRLRKARDRGG